MRRIGKEDWHVRFININGVRYLYPVSDWPEILSNRTKVSIICPIHGVFGQTLDSHFSGQGCSKCTKGHKPKSRDVKVKMAKNVHGDTYDYSLLPDDFMRHDKVRIICRTHGEFNQSFHLHLKGRGCAECKGKTQRELYIHNVGNVALKYGIANNSERRRVEQDQKSPLEVMSLVVYRFDTVEKCKSTEAEIKKMFGPVLSKRDLPDGWTETTLISNFDKLVEIIEGNGGLLSI